MKYIAIDLEWNQAQVSSKTKILEDGKRFTGEIVQIGAVKLDASLGIESMFKTEIKPHIYKKMNSKVSELTGITGEMLENAPSFSECIEKFVEWCEPDAVFLTWGVDDIRVLRQNCRVNGVSFDFCKTWYNLQVLFNMQTDTGSNQKSLSAATEHFSIENTLKAHDALNDAYYTAMIAKKLDLVKGIAEYPGAKCALCGTSGGKSVFAGQKSRRAAFSNREILNPVCPVCEEKMAEIAPFVRVNRYKSVSIGRCAQHGEFSIKLRLTDAKDGTKTVHRTVHECKSADREQYDFLVAKELEKQLKKTELQGDNTPLKPEKKEGETQNKERKNGNKEEK